MRRGRKIDRSRRPAIERLLENATTVVTAGTLSRMFLVTERQIYRDMRKLKAANPRIIGEAGMGYMMRRVR